VIEPRIRVSALLGRGGKILLCRHEKGGRAHWLLPGGGVHGGETLVNALRRELAEEVGLPNDFPLEGPIAVCESISPADAEKARHVVHIIFAGYLGDRSLERVSSSDAAVRGHRLFELEELTDISLHPPIQRFLARWQPGDPVVYLGALWAP
jgi:ADP-ribose pyrophosphatase YjhB (NUDIX family)